jgi:Spy/CpxP family protein refolding chaperone
VLAAVAVALLASPVLAQQRRPFGGGMMMPSVMLLNQKSVQEDLKLTDDQVKKVAEAGKQMREKFGELANLEGEERAKKAQELRKESDKTVAGILTKEQTKRLQEIRRQVMFRFMGAVVLSTPEVAKELNLTDDQKKQLRTIQEEAGKELRKIREDAGDNREEARKKIAEHMKGVNAKLMKVLTSDQQTRWKEMTGKPFKGEIRFGPPRRRDT